MPIITAPRSHSVLLALLAILAGALPAAEIPDGGTDLITPEAWLAARLVRGPDPQASLAVVAVEGMDFDRALRITTTRKPPKPWNIQLHADTTGALERGDAVLISLWMRTLESADESGDGSVTVRVQQGHPPYRGVGGKVSAGRDWRHCLVPAIARWPLAEGDHRLEFHLGGWPQSVEIGGLRVLDYGETPLGELPHMEITYPGREPDAPWRAAAAERIERLRTGELTVRVRDAGGRPLPGAAVQVRMRRHAFAFGSVVNPGPLLREDADGERYRELVAAHFNRAPTEWGFRWPTWERRTPEWRAEKLEMTGRTLDWLVAHDIEVRGHYLMWAPIQERNKPKELLDRPEELLQAKWQHAEKMARWAGERIDEWDAVNHIVGWGTTFADVCAGGNQVYADMITRGRAWAPHAEMWINEGQILVGGGDRLPEYKAMVADLIARGARPDGIGFMAHFRDSDLPAPEEVWRRLEEFAPFGCQLQLTELDVGGGSDEQLHADYLRDVMTVAFSHPQMDGIVLWGFWEGAHWRPSAALWRRDWSLKPAGRAWLDLVRGKWWTEVDGTADAEGAYRCRGFLGDYAITATAGGRTGEATATLARDGSAVTVTVE